MALNFKVNHIHSLIQYIDSLPNYKIESTKSSMQTEKIDSSVMTIAIKLKSNQNICQLIMAFVYQVPSVVDFHHGVLGVLADVI